MKRTASKFTGHICLYFEIAFTKQLQKDFFDSETETHDAFETFDNLNKDQQFYYLFHYFFFRVIYVSTAVKRQFYLSSFTF